MSYVIAVNPEVFAELKADQELFVAWCLKYPYYDEDINPLHNPDYVKQYAAAEVAALKHIKEEIARLKDQHSFIDKLKF